MSRPNSGFKSSSFNSDFGSEFSVKSQKTTSVSFLKFPRSPAVGGEMADLYCTSKTLESYPEFTKQMTMLQRHVTAYMDAVDKNDYRQMVSALTSVPEMKEVQMHLFNGKSSKYIYDFYSSRMCIKR